ncbi:MAG TPA: hypothetical protein VJN71_01420, partial [Nitrososphaerales archaeon]|nr:hypothetical protein [Nitrososphaerales archaeon]
SILFTRRTLRPSEEGLKNIHTAALWIFSDSTKLGKLPLSKETLNLSIKSLSSLRNEPSIVSLVTPDTP